MVDSLLKLPPGMLALRMLPLSAGFEEPDGSEQPDPHRNPAYPAYEDLGEGPFETWEAATNFGGVNFTRI